MQQNYTEETLVKFIYGECDIFERLEIEFALTEDYLLLENYKELVFSYEQLPKVKFAPKTSTISAILKYGANNFEALC